MTGLGDLDNVKTGERLGLDLLSTNVSGQNDFDRYEGLQWYAADESPSTSGATGYTSRRCGYTSKRMLHTLWSCG